MSSLCRLATSPAHEAPGQPPATFCPYVHEYERQGEGAVSTIASAAIVAIMLSASMLVSIAHASPQDAQDFPEVQDWNSLRMSFECQGGFWDAPTYRIEVSGDGAVWYEGLSGVATKGPIPLTKLS